MSCSSTLVSSFSMVIKFDAINVTKFLVQTKELVTNFSKKKCKRQLDRMLARCFGDGWNCYASNLVAVAVVMVSISEIDRL